MVKVAIVTDSTADMAPDVAEALGITVVPADVIFGKEVFRDGVDIVPQEFYRKLKESAALPTTSQPSAGSFLEVFRELAQTADSIISIHVAAPLSGTLQSAHAAKELLGSSVPIHIVDSRSVSMGLGFVVLAAAQMAAEGMDAPQIVERIQALIPRINILFTVDTLEYLHKGGRIGGAERLFGSILSIRPLLEIADGRVEALEKTRTKRRAVARLLEIAEERIGSAPAVHATVLHAAAYEAASQLKQEVEARFPCQELHICELGPAVGTNAGPGTLGLVFYTEED
jgi:DegV family protein with EDD domain